VGGREEGAAGDCPKTKSTIAALPALPSNQWGDKNSKSGKSQDRKFIWNLASSYFNGEGAFRNRFAELVELDSGVQEVVQGQNWCKKLVEKAVVGVVKELADHYEHVALALKHVVGISFEQYGKIRHYLSYKFQLPQDLSWSDLTDQGHYLQLVFTKFRNVTFPRLPSYNTLRKEEDRIVQVAGGYKVSRDGQGGYCEFFTVLKQTMVRNIDKVLAMPLVLVQVFGDGFQMFRSCKYVNFCLRVCGVHVLSGSADSCDTLNVWKGSDAYHDIKLHCKEALVDIATLERDREIVLDGNTVKCMPCGGGDAMFISDVMGLSNFACKHSCNYCEKEQANFADLMNLAELRTYNRACTAAHVPLPGQAYPIQCPFCGEVSEEEANKIKHWSKEKCAEHSRCHGGQLPGRAPLIEGMDHERMPECALHLLLNITGTMYKHAIAAKVPTKEIAQCINIFLHQVLHVYVRPVKVMSKAEVATVLKRPSFVGSEADTVLRHFEDLMLILNQGADLQPIQRKELAAVGAFMDVYNRIATKLTNPHDQSERGAKADEVQELALAFHHAYIAAFGDGSAYTYYVHTLVEHISCHIRDLPCDIMDLSGQGLEHCNKLRKSNGKLTNHHTFTADDVTKGGKRKRGIMDQLLTMDAVRKSLGQDRDLCLRPSLYFRQKMQKLGSRRTALAKEELCEGIAAYYDKSD
jgi:hypothetical protein